MPTYYIKYNSYFSISPWQTIDIDFYICYYTLVIKFIDCNNPLSYEETYSSHLPHLIFCFRRLWGRSCLASHFWDQDREMCHHSCETDEWQIQSRVYLFYQINMQTLELWESIRENRGKQAEIICSAHSLGWNDQLEDNFVALAETEQSLLNQLYYA